MPVSCNDRNLITDWGGVLSRDEIVALHVTKVDAIDHTVTILEFDCLNGELIEVNADTLGFDVLRCKLADYLPLPIDWYDQIEATRIGESLTLFDRRTRTS